MYNPKIIINMIPNNIINYIETAECKDLINMSGITCQCIDYYYFDDEEDKCMTCKNERCQSCGDNSLSCCNLLLLYLYHFY